jgi:DNA-binding transcriptional LysR family regulator
MDRLDDMLAFAVAADEGSLAAAGRKLGRSPPAMTRAIANLEARTGSALFERTTRSIRLTATGEHFLMIARRILAEYDEMMLAGPERGPLPSGLLTVTGPVIAGAELLRPIVDRYLDRYPQTQVQLLLFDREARIVDEGIDVALRIGHLPDSTLIAQRIGTVRTIICASPAYLAARGPLNIPSDLKHHRIIAMAGTRHADGWGFTTSSGIRRVRIKPRLSVTSIEAARASAIEGGGIARLLSYQVATAIQKGELISLLQQHGPPPIPVHLVAPKSRLATIKTRAFIDLAAPALRDAFLDLEI